MSSVREHPDLDWLLSRWGLPLTAAEPLASLIRILATDPTAPTTIRAPGHAINDHLADSLVALELPEVRRARRLADVGSGAGFPGLPLAIALPEAEVFLVESNRRKCAYMGRALASARVANATVVEHRAEEWIEGRERHDLVTARALAPLPVVVEYAAPLLRIGGSLVAWRGKPDPEAERDTSAAVSALGLEATARIRVIPYSGAEHRFLHVFRKVTKTPERFPRRPGAALKRPLAASAREC